MRCGIQNRQHHQIRQSEKQPLGLLARGFSGAFEESQMTALREGAQIGKTDSRQQRNLFVGEKFLA